MIRHIGALAALLALSLSSVACVAGSESEAAEVAETSQELGSRSAYFETFEGLDGHHYFHLVAGNGENLLRSEGYSSRAAAEDGVASVLTNAVDARNFKMLASASGEHYFDVVAGNGKIIATSEFYSTKAHAERGARTVRSLVRIVRQDSKLRAAPLRERFELFTGEDGGSYFHLRAGNGEILLSSESYAATAGARDGVESVRSAGTDASRFEVFETEDGRWGVRLTSSNGEVIARGQSYASKAGADRAVARIVEILEGTVGISG